MRSATLTYRACRACRACRVWVSSGLLDINSHQRCCEDFPVLCLFSFYLCWGSSSILLDLPPWKTMIRAGSDSSRFFIEGPTNQFLASMSLGDLGQYPRVSQDHI